MLIADKLIHKAAEYFLATLQVRTGCDSPQLPQYSTYEYQQHQACAHDHYTLSVFRKFLGKYLISCDFLRASC